MVRGRRQWRIGWATDSIGEGWATYIAQVPRGRLAPGPVVWAPTISGAVVIWEDNRLEVVAIFGKYADGATANTDDGIAAYNVFVSAMKAEL